MINQIPGQPGDDFKIKQRQSIFSII